MREYRSSGFEVRFVRIQIRIMVGLGVLVIPLAALCGKESERWDGVGIAAFIFLIALGFHIAVNRSKPRVVVVQPEGLRYGHIPDSPLIPWATIRSVRERRLGQRLDLVDADRVTRISLDYNLEGFAELQDLVLERVHIAMPTPVCFRRSRGVDFCMISFGGLMLVGSILSGVWMGCLGVAAVAFLLREESKNPFAVQVTDSELIVSFVFRTLTIPLQELQLTSATQRQNGVAFQHLQVEEPHSDKPILIRQVGVDAIVLKATIVEAIRKRPLAVRSKPAVRVLD